MKEYKIIISINLGDDSSLEKLLHYIVGSMTRTIVTQNWKTTKYSIECFNKIGGQTGTLVGISSFGNHDAPNEDEKQ